jgi:hypothetical protein
VPTGDTHRTRTNPWQIPEIRKAESPPATPRSEILRKLPRCHEHNPPSAPSSPSAVRSTFKAAFFHTAGSGREVRVLELDTNCPDCSDTFQATASLRQIRTRQLIRRCPRCRKLHTGPVAMPPVDPKARVGKARRVARRSKGGETVRRKTKRAERKSTRTAAPARPCAPAAPAVDMDTYRNSLGMLD